MERLNKEVAWRKGKRSKNGNSSSFVSQLWRLMLAAARTPCLHCHFHFYLKNSWWRLGWGVPDIICSSSVHSMQVISSGKHQWKKSWHFIILHSKWNKHHKLNKYGGGKMRKLSWRCWQSSWSSQKWRRSWNKQEINKEDGRVTCLSTHVGSLVVLAAAKDMARSCETTLDRLFYHVAHAAARVGDRSCVNTLPWSL